MTRRVLVCAALLLVAACSSPTTPRATLTTTHRTSPAPSRSIAATTAAPPLVPHFAHVVVVVEENRAYADVIGSSAAPYLNRLARSGALLTRSYGITHPSEPNYLALFSGSTHGLTDDSCPHTYTGNNLAAQLRARGSSFAGYAESLPRAGYSGCTAGEYARKHAPWTDFRNVPASLGRPMSAFPSDYTRLPTLSFVIPNLAHDMHDGSVSQGDSWLHAHLGGYATWARTHNSLLIVTWDEDDFGSSNHIPGLLAGAHVRTAQVGARVDHYTMLRTIEAVFALPALGRAAQRRPLTTVWAP